MDIRQFLLNSFPKCIDKSGEFFNALVTNENRTGALETALQDARDYSMYYVNTPEILKQEGEMLAKTMSFVSFLERFTNESEESWKNRYKAIFVRNHNKTWGTPFDVKEVFRSYFPSAQIYLIENTNSTSDENNENLIKNGDFLDSSIWNFENCGLDFNARFSKTYGVSLLDNTAELSQTIVLPHNNKTYTLHLFVKGGVNVAIKNNNGMYWNVESLLWQKEEYKTPCEFTDWDNLSIFFFAKESTSITIEVTKKEDSEFGYVDYFRFFEKKNYPSFTILACFTGSATKSAIALAPYNADSEDGQTPLPEVANKVDNFAFYNQNSLTGVATGFAQDIYNDLINYVKPAGIKAYIEIVNRDFDDNKENV